MNLFVLFSYLLILGSGWLNVEAMINFAPYCVTHHTGSATRLAIAFTDGNYSLFWGLIWMITAFIIGAGVSSFINKKGNNNFTLAFPIFHIISAIALLIIVFTAENTYFMYLYCSFFAGFQNGAVSQFGLRAGHMSGIATDAGLAFGRAAKSIVRRDPNSKSKAKSFLATGGMHTLSIFVFATGGLIGVLLTGAMPLSAVFTILVIFNIGCAIFYIYICRRIKRETELNEDFR